MATSFARVATGLFALSMLTATSILAYKDLLEIRELRRRRAAEREFESKLNVHNYLHEIASGVSYEAYHDRMLPVLDYVTVSLKLCARSDDDVYTNMTHSQFALLHDDDVAVLLAAAIIRAEGREAYYKLFPIGNLMYTHSLGRYIDISLKNGRYDTTVVTVTAEDLKILASTIRRIVNERKSDPLIIGLRKHKQQLMQRLKKMPDRKSQAL